MTRKPTRLSDEVQLELAKSALLIPALSANIFKSKPAPFVAQSVYTEKVRTIFDKKYKEFLRGKDINTTIREINEEGDRWIEAAK